MFSRKIISVVDDDVCVRGAIESLLESSGFDVLAFASAEEFLNSGRIDHTSCLVTDLRMPGLTGLDLQKRLAAEGTSPPVIFITAFATERTRNQAIDAGAVGFLDKPFSDQALIDCINTALSQERPNLG
jgi:FixJ family two-component response regulator